MPNRKLTLAALTLSLISGLSVVQAGTIIYSQAATPATEGYSAWESEAVSAEVNARTYDDFTLKSAARIGVVIWEGIYVNQVETTANPAPANSTSFEISFWSDDGGQPGTMLAASTVPYGALHATKLAERKFPLSTGEVTVSSFAYLAKLPTTFAAEAGKKYWLSVLSNSTSLEPVWGWTSGVGGDGVTIQDYEGRQTRTQDRVFGLESAAEPAVTVAASTPMAHLSTRQAGVFRFKVLEPQSNPLTIHYSLNGTAVNGEDYDRLTGIVKLKALATTATVRVVPKGTLEGAAHKTVKLLLEATGDYVVGTKEPVTITIDK